MPPRDPNLDNLPKWAKVASTLTGLMVIVGLFIVLVFNLIAGQGSKADMLERLVDKFDTILERHDTRQREWMTSHGATIRSENEKTRAKLIEISIRQENSHREISKFHEASTKLHEEQLGVLRQMLQSKGGMP